MYRMCHEIINSLSLNSVTDRMTYKILNRNLYLNSVTELQIEVEFKNAISLFDMQQRQMWPTKNIYCVKNCKLL